jgi:hypothetical protein
MPRFPSRIGCAAAGVIALFSAFAPARAEVLLVTYTSRYVGTEVFKFNTLDGSGVPGYGDSEISFPLLYDSQGSLAAPGPRHGLLNLKQPLWGCAGQRGAARFTIAFASTPASAP